MLLQEKVTQRIVYFHIVKKQEVLVKKVSEDALAETNLPTLKYPHTHKCYYTTECTRAHSRVILLYNLLNYNYVDLKTACFSDSSKT